jgi:hypothetical protein
MTIEINAVSACWSSYSYQDAIKQIHNGTNEPTFGTLSTKHVQLCPQHSNFLTDDILNQFLIDYPKIQFRLHSDIRLKNKIGIAIDLIDFSNETMWYFKELNRLSQIINAPLYSLHAGHRTNKSLSDLFHKAHQLQDIFHCPIAIEGHYPLKNKYLIDSWSEYQQLLDSGLNYALDLSHLNIVAFREGWNYDLTNAMLTSTQCKEIHLSFNDGHLDNHQISHSSFNSLWVLWKKMIIDSKTNATIFSEGNQVLELRKQAKNLL